MFTFKCSFYILYYSINKYKLKSLSFPMGLCGIKVLILGPLSLCILTLDIFLVSIWTVWSQQGWPCVPRLAVSRKLKVTGALSAAKTILPAPVKHPLRALSLAQDSSAFPPLAYQNALSALTSTISVSLASTPPPPPHHLLLGSLRCVTLHIRGASWLLSVGNELCRFSGNVIHTTLT